MTTAAPLFPHLEETSPPQTRRQPCTLPLLLSQVRSQCPECAWCQTGNRLWRQQRKCQSKMLCGVFVFGAMLNFSANPISTGGVGGGCLICCSGPGVLIPEPWQPNTCVWVIELNHSEKILRALMGSVLPVDVVQSQTGRGLKEHFLPLHLFMSLQVGEKHLKCFLD